MGDVRDCKLSLADDSEDKNRKTIMCPLTKVQLDDGGKKAVLVWPTGAVLGEAALKEMMGKKTEDLRCPVTNQAFDRDKDVITLAGDAEEVEKLRALLPAKKRKRNALTEEGKELEGGSKASKETKVEKE